MKSASRPGLKRACLLIPALLLWTACSGADTDATADTADMPEEHSSPHAPTAAEQAEILGVLQAVFDGLAGDTELLAHNMDADIVMHSTDLRSGTAVFGSSTLPGLIQRVETGDETMTERMWAPEVHVSGGIATVWTPYDFYIGSEFSHCGVDVATLMPRDGRWKVITLDWTRDAPPNCALHPDGPPSN
ncbi:MAG TPA: hypothetical protein EYQ27_19540 [Gemmatimonadetes bacterium]|nr:hypothetical protein [Gemmatimonadota bacterium]